MYRKTEDCRYVRSEIIFQILTCESYLIYRWEFLSEGYDIGIGVYRKTADGKQKIADMVGSDVKLYSKF